MKAIINELIEKIESYKDSGSVGNCLRLSQEILTKEREIQSETDKHKLLKDEEMKYMQNANRIVKMDDKNPINFFGEALLKKDTEIGHHESTIKLQKVKTK